MKLKMKYMKLKYGKRKLTKHLKYKTQNHKYDFQQYETIRLFSESSYGGKISIDQAEMNQSNLLKNFI